MMRSLSQRAAIARYARMRHVHGAQRHHLQVVAAAVLAFCHAIVRALLGGAR